MTGSPRSHTLDSANQALAQPSLLAVLKLLDATKGLRKLSLYLPEAKHEARIEQRESENLLLGHGKTRTSPVILRK